jgi:glutamate/tyrosine decarboxylase-like PLP-dependent enzyme
MVKKANTERQPSNGLAADWWDPDLEPEEYRRLGYQAVDMMVDYFDSIRDRRVFPGKSSQEVARVFQEPLPQSGAAADEILEEWATQVLPNATHLGSPRYFGYVNGSGTMIATLAEALASAVNMNPGGWKASPAATEMERRTIAWIAELIGYPVGCGGLLTSGGTMANFTGIMTGLRNTAPYETTSDGLQSQDRRGRHLIYMADHEGHVSIERVADLLNLGRNAVRRVPSREDFTMDPEALAAMIEADRARGDLPFCVVAQVGSINTGAIDPLEDIADICETSGLWFHADGACGAVGAILPEKEKLYIALDRADSVTLDPHKWLFIPYECGCILVRDPEKLRRAFSMSAPYLRGTLPTAYTGLDYFEYGPQMSRGFRALKVWMTLKHYGVEGYRKLLSQGIRCAERLDERVRASNDFEQLHEPNLYIYSFRYAPIVDRKAAQRSKLDQDRVDARLDRLNQRIADEIQARGIAFIMTTKIHQRTVLRMSICSHRTTLDDIDAVFDALTRIGRELSDVGEAAL